MDTTTKLVALVAMLVATYMLGTSAIAAFGVNHLKFVVWSLATLAEAYFTYDLAVNN